MALYSRQGSRPSPRERNAKKHNDCPRRPSIAVKKRAAKNKAEKERYSHLNAEFQRIAGRDEIKPSSVINAKK